MTVGDTLQPGERIGRYTIESELGRGLLGISYKARDADGEVVALKVLSADAPLTDDEKAGIARDFHALEDLQSPQVPVLLEFVRYYDSYVIATDYLPLGDFSRRLAQGPLPLPAALTLIRHLTYAVGRAHEAGVVHGGIKPTNVLRGEVNGRQIPVLSDFGGSLRHHPWIRPEGVNVGDAYRAPEVQGGGDVTPASDVYSLGILLAAMTGGLANAGVAAVIARASDERPAQRYKNASEMYEALSAVGSTPDPVVDPAPASIAAPSASAYTEVSSVKAEALPQTPSETSVPAGAQVEAPVADRAAERARILNSAEVAGAERGYRSKGPLIAGVIAAALLVLALSLLLTKNNVFNQPEVVPNASVSKVTSVPNGGVRFDLAPTGQPSNDSIIRKLQVFSSGSWQDLPGNTYTARTPVGGEQVCLKFRVTDQNATNATSTNSDAVSACGKTGPTLTVTVTPGNCSINGFTQVCYDFLAAGLQPGTKHVLTLRLQGQVIGTTSLTVNKQGRASLPRGVHFHFESTTGGQRASVTFAGMTTSWFVANT